MQFIFIIIILLIIGGLLYMQTERFGSTASAERLATMEKKPNYKEGAFDNVEYTPALAEGVSYIDMLKGFFFSKKERNRPSVPLPVVRTNLKALPKSQNAFIWFGHSSYFMLLDGKSVLVDPVFSKYASPVPVSVKAFELTYNYNSDDIPDIDLLIITHDHWDHLDYNTFQRIKHKVKYIVTALGVGAHLEKWGFPKENITELYWGESTRIYSFDIISTTSRHFSGRTFKRNTTLWSSFILSSNTKKIFVGGDSGYGKHFKDIGTQYGPFDIAILENGQYNTMWKYIHMMPEEVIQASKDLNARYTIPVHCCKFPLANHSWDEPLNRIYKEAQKQRQSLLTPHIGEIVHLDNVASFASWWKDVE